jgi:hypothetical protein
MINVVMAGVHTNEEIERIISNEKSGLTGKYRNKSGETGLEQTGNPH